jgi:6-pyruvoyltetrahydropterin/6-carboxytetrahydropterin synthase
MFGVDIRHNVEMAHRLLGDRAPEKCRSIHGHSWWVTLRLEGPSLDGRDMLVEFGALKRAWRGWLDDHLDHHLVVHENDPLARWLADHEPWHRLRRVPFSPTTERLAAWMAERAREVVASVTAGGVPCHVVEVHLQETAVNAARWRPLV